jgi:septum formation protein
MPDDPYLAGVEGSVSNVIGLPMESLERARGWMAGMW